MRRIALLLTVLAAPALALPMHVTDDQAFYSPNATALVTVTGDTAAGTLSLALCGPTPALLSRPAAPQVTFQLPVGVASQRLVVNALAPGDKGTATCTGSGSNAAHPLAIATGALAVAGNAWTDPVEGFVDAPTLAATPPAVIAASLARYYVTLVQCYDCTWRQDEPYNPAAAWPNLENVTVTRASLLGLQAALHEHGAKLLAYQLWNGAWPDFRAANPHVTPAMGLFTKPPATQAFTDGGAPGVWHGYGWQADRIVEENPYSQAWQHWIISQWQALVVHDGFDFIHIDTLGDPAAPVYDAEGHRLPDVGGAMPGFIHAAHSRLGCVDINQVSGWDVDAIPALQVCDVYVEPHPEFGNLPTVASLFSFMDQVRALTPKPVILAYYPEQQLCTPNRCAAHDPGAELLFSSVALAGASPLLMGDVNHLVPGPFFPRPSLAIDPALQQYLTDGWTWFIAERALLRAGRRSPLLVQTDDHALFATGWTTATGAIGIALLNQTGRLDDPDGTANPAPVYNLHVTLRARGTFWLTAPDINHGIPQLIAERQTGDLVRLTVPLLRTGALLSQASK